MSNPLDMHFGGFQEEPLHYITDSELKRLRAIEAASLAVPPAPVRDAAERFPAHYCAMDHIKVWHNDEVPGQPEELSCPVCFERARVAGLEAELACEKAAHLVTAREFEFQRERAAGLERERDSYRNEHRILEAKYGKVCDDRDAARALLADARETIGWIMSSREGAALFGIDVDRALKAEAEIAAGNTVSWEELRLELTAKARALAQPRAERETKE